MEFTYFIPFFFPIGAMMVCWEMYVGFRRGEKLYERKDTIANLLVGSGAVFFQVVTKVATLALFGFFYNYTKSIRLQYLSYESLGWAWWVWVFAIIGDDFSFYWHHRWSHAIRILWASHIMHHSSFHYNFTVGFRNGWSIFLYKPFFWIWMPVLGFHPVMILSAMAINSLYQFWLHTERIPRLGILEKVFVTPQLHRVHHASNLELIDRNYGGIFIVWDRLFGTYHNGRIERKIKYGVSIPPNSFNPLIIFIHEYLNIWKDIKQTKSWKDKFKLVFYSPSWSYKYKLEKKGNKSNPEL